MPTSTLAESHHWSESSTWPEVILSSWPKGLVGTNLATSNPCWGLGWDKKPWEGLQGAMGC